ncbi:chromate transporter [Peribacillus simplex]|uniref:chromate transporter n=1 Tax=Peribacillus simplex TaxID=1478 RepID=UPI00298DB91D|nr:chromate transporter [Peribacillus simplex]MDW7615656.1 chromate transporter [Peribacillus simplex]
MMELWELFSTFFIIGFVSFGGGYAMIPVIGSEVSQHGWMTTQQFTDVIAISGMSPGPITTNSAILVGYSTAGLAGAISSALGILLPAIIIIIVIATFFSKLNHYPIIQSMFYGLRPIVTSLILFAAISFAISNHLIAMNFSWHTISLLLVFGLSLFALLKLRWHPAYVLILSGLVGVVFYS